MLKLNYLCKVSQVRIGRLYTGDEAQLDYVVANGFWECRQNAYFDAKVFNLFAPMQCSVCLLQCYRHAAES